MKKFKNLFIIALCFTFVLTATTVPTAEDIVPYGHHDNNRETI